MERAAPRGRVRLRAGGVNQPRAAGARRPSAALVDRLPTPVPIRRRLPGGRGAVHRAVASGRHDGAAAAARAGGRAARCRRHHPVDCRPGRPRAEPGAGAWLSAAPRQPARHDSHGSRERDRGGVQDRPAADRQRGRHLQRRDCRAAGHLRRLRRRDGGRSQGRRREAGGQAGGRHDPRRPARLAGRPARRAATTRRSKPRTPERSPTAPRPTSAAAGRCVGLPLQRHRLLVPHEPRRR